MEDKHKNSKRNKQNNFDRDVNIKIDQIDYKNVNTLLKYINSRFKIVPGKYTKLSAKIQRKLSTEVKKARFVGLIKYTERH